VDALRLNEAEFTEHSEVAKADNGGYNEEDEQSCKKCDSLERSGTLADSFIFFN